MSYTFGETVRGVHLADTLIGTLTGLAKDAKEKEEILKELKGIREDLLEIKELLKDNKA